MENLISHIDISNGRDELIPGGSSCFNALYAGYILYDINIIQGQRRFSFTHKDLGFETYFITTSYRASVTFPIVYAMQIMKNQSEIFPIDADMEGFYSVRCVKD